MPYGFCRYNEKKIYGIHTCNVCQLRINSDMSVLIDT